MLRKAVIAAVKISVCSSSVIVPFFENCHCDGVDFLPLLVMAVAVVVRSRSGKVVGGGAGGDVAKAVCKILRAVAIVAILILQLLLPSSSVVQCCC